MMTQKKERKKDRREREKRRKIERGDALKHTGGEKKRKYITMNRIGKVTMKTTRKERWRRIKAG